MARPPVVPPHLPPEELERRHRRARDPVLRSYYQIAWLLPRGEASAAATARYHPDRVRRVAK